MSEVRKDEKESAILQNEELKRHSGQFDIGCYNFLNGELELIDNTCEVVDDTVRTQHQLPSFSLQFGADDIQLFSIPQVPDQHPNFLPSNSEGECQDFSLQPSVFNQTDFKSPQEPVIDLPPEDLSELSFIGDDYGLSEFLSPLEQSIDFNFLSEFQS